MTLNISNDYTYSYYIDTLTIKVLQLEIEIVKKYINKTKDILCISYISLLLK